MSYSKTEYPIEIISLAKKRTNDLLSGYCVQLATIPQLLVSAYLQGIVDTVETLKEDQPNDKD